jgi:hypothetical protein
MLRWHLGFQPGFHPSFRGFDEYFGLPFSNDVGCLSVTAWNWEPFVNGATYPQGEQPEPRCNYTAPPPGGIACDARSKTPVAPTVAPASVVTNEMRREAIRLLGDDLEPFVAVLPQACATTSAGAPPPGVRRSQSARISCADYKQEAGVIYTGHKKPSASSTTTSGAACCALCATVGKRLVFPHCMSCPDKPRTPEEKLKRMCFLRASRTATRASSASRGASATAPALSGRAFQERHSLSPARAVVTTERSGPIHTAASSQPSRHRCMSHSNRIAARSSRARCLRAVDKVQTAAIMIFLSSQSTSRRYPLGTPSARWITSHDHAMHSEASSSMPHSRTCTCHKHTSHSGCTRRRAKASSATRCEKLTLRLGRSVWPLTTQARRPKRYSCSRRTTALGTSSAASQVRRVLSLARGKRTRRGAVAARRASSLLGANNRPTVSTFSDHI